MKLSARSVLIFVFLVAVVVRVGYGVAHYGRELSLTGDQFIQLWDHDALEHVLIAKAIMDGDGYTVDAGQDLTGKHPRFVGESALFKAPLYQYFLAAIFSISGFSFLLFFPLQALLGGGISVVISKIAMHVFSAPRIGLYAGVAAAVHPVLVNTASQPYNENLFFFLFFLTVLLFLDYLRSPTLRRAVIVGVLAGLTTLTRESMLAPFLVMVGIGVLQNWRVAGSLPVRKAFLMLTAFLITIVPWTVHNYLQVGLFVPVSSISGTSLGMANNECVVGGLNEPFDAEGACRSLDARRYALLKEMPSQPSAVWDDRAYAQLGREFVLHHPLDYMSLCFRRAWTTFLPYHPRQDLGSTIKLGLTIYFVLVVLVGLASVIILVKRGLTPSGKVLLWVALATYAPLVLVYVSTDLRYRVGIDLLLGCFAASTYETATRWISRPLKGAAKR